jgi:hypothetical protein
MASRNAQQDEGTFQDVVKGLQAGEAARLILGSGPDHRSGPKIKLETRSAASLRAYGLTGRSRMAHTVVPSMLSSAHPVEL